MMPQPTIAVLYFHHAADALTQHHYELLQKQNADDADIFMAPICFPEYAEQCLPGTYVPEHLAEFRTNPSRLFHRFRHDGKPILSDLDCLIWDWVLYGGKSADRIILAEGDMLSRCGIREFFAPSFVHALSGSVPRHGRNRHKGWMWFEKGSQSAIESFGEDVASVTPVCGIQLSWELAEQIAELVRSAKGGYDDLHVEMVIPSLAKKFGVDVQATVMPPGLNILHYIDFIPAGLRMGPWGIFHPVKQVYRQPNRLAQRAMPLTVITLWRPEWTVTQQAVLNYLMDENFPDGTEFIWSVERGSSAAAVLNASELDTRLTRHSVHFLEVEIDVVPHVKHDVVAFQYNQTLAMVQSAMVLLVEDDVLANLGTWDVLRKTWEQLGETRAACMVAYKTRTRPNCICAGDIYTGYLPWRGSAPQAPPSKVNWVGGGYTLYDADAVKMCLPVVPTHHPSWTKGWDVDLCEKLRAGKRDVFVSESVVAEHLF